MSWSRERAPAVLMATALVMFWVASAARADGLDAIAGKALFERTWIAAPSSTDASDGLGPFFNGRSCAACHAGGGGARIVRAPDGSKQLAGAVVRLGTKSGDADAFYGRQLQTGAVTALMPEANIRFFPKLKITFSGPALAQGIHTSVRVAPPLWGRAAFDRISDSEILSRADPDDSNGDGISGRAHRIGSSGDGGRVGRFGWKAAHATLQDQIAHAFSLDMGLSSALQPAPSGDCTRAQQACLQAPTGESALGGGHEISKTVLGLTAVYLQSLDAPAWPSNHGGAAVFAETGCARCHVPELTASDGSRVVAFTDLLLHDMGQNLDDGVGEEGVPSNEWRTAPLRSGNPATLGRRYLHDGSATSIAGAIAKHAGEAAQSRQAFQKLNSADQARLIDYLGGQ